MENSAILTVGLENLDIEYSARVAQRAVLEEIYLVDAKTWRDALVICPEALVLEHKCSTEILHPGDEERLDLDLILCNFRIAAFGDKSPNKLVMKIEATYCTSFSMPLDLVPDLEDSDETFRVWREYCFKVNPISTAWPYWREFVQSMSTRMGFPALTVPLLEITAKKAVEKEAKSQPVKKGSTRRKKVSA